MSDRTCLRCSGPVTGMATKLFCSERCQKQGPSGALSTGTKGAIGELRAAADLLARGFEVFRALSPHCSCDLAILLDGRVLRVEVRCGTRAPNGRINVNRAGAGRADITAIVLPDAVLYEPDLPQGVA